MTPRIALCAIMRNEAASLIEWVSYHKAIGFTDITIYDNDSTDGTAGLCQKLAQAGHVGYVRWPSKADPVFSNQVLAYRHAAARCGAGWLCFLDADEFLVLERAGSVQELLARAGAAGMPVALSWRIFGSGGAAGAGPEPVIERFTRCAPPGHAANTHIKTLAPRSALDGGAQAHVHGWVLAPGQFYVDACGERIEVDRHTFLPAPRWRCAWVNHYIVKSLDEYRAKMARGAVSRNEGDPLKYSRDMQGYFAVYDQNDEEDRTIQRFLPATLAGMAALRAAL